MDKHANTSNISEAIEIILKLDNFVEFFVYLGINNTSHNNNENSLLTISHLTHLQHICEQHILNRKDKQLMNNFITSFPNGHIKSTPFQLISLIIQSIKANYNNNHKLINKLHNIISPIILDPKEFLLKSTEDENIIPEITQPKSMFYYILHPNEAINKTKTQNKTEYDNDIDIKYYTLKYLDINIDNTEMKREYKSTYLLIELSNKEYKFDDIPKKCCVNGEYYKMKYVIAYNKKSKGWIDLEMESIRGMLEEEKLNELEYKDILYVNENMGQC